MDLQIVRLTKEDTYGVYDTTSPVSANIFLPQSNAMTVRVIPSYWKIRDSGQGNRPIRSSVGRTGVSGSLQTYLFPDQAGFLLDLAAGLTGTAPCYNLPSFTIDHLVITNNCQAIYKRYLGCKFGSFNLAAASADGEGCLVAVNADVIGSTTAAITSTDFPTPSLSAYPSTDPYEFYHAAGHLTIGSSRTNFQTLNLSIKNITKAFMDENRYAQAVDWFGRDVTFSAKVRYKSTADRDAFEAGTKRAASFQFVKGANSVTFNLGGQVVVDGVGDDFPLDGYFTQDISMSAMMDPTLGTPTDLTVTVA